jgi:hypothetical protein
MNISYGDYVRMTVCVNQLAVGDQFFDWFKRSGPLKSIQPAAIEYFTCNLSATSGVLDNRGWLEPSKGIEQIELQQRGKDEEVK